MDDLLKQVQTEIYDICAFDISDFKYEVESKEYNACTFILDKKHLVCRSAKITPKKIGQFVTFWKRKGDGPIEPFDENDAIDFYIVNVSIGGRLGQFVFPRSILLKKGIISTVNKEGKRAFRVYPKWDAVKSKQAIRTQKWQLDYFYEVNSSVDLEKVATLYGAK